MKVVKTFFYKYLEEKIYKKQLVGFEPEVQERLVCELSKSLYELKQAHVKWNMSFDKFMKTQGFSRSVYDTCV